MKTFITTLLAGIAVLVISGCAPMQTSQVPLEVRQGRIEQITEVQVQHPHELGVGAILGGAAGAGIGSLIGAGTGKDVAIAVGAIAGAVGGQYAENKYEKPVLAQQIVVRLTSGVLVVVTQQPPNGGLYKGQNVYVEGAGSTARISPM